MRIALFSGNYNYLREGANQALNKLVAYLERDAGHQVRVYSPVTATPAFEPAGTLVPVKSVRLPVRGEFQLALGLPRDIRRDIARFAPDVIHVSTPDILCTRAQTYARQIGVPIVASLHTMFETYPAYYGVGWLEPIVKAHLKRFYRRSNHVLAPTSGLVTEMKALRGDDRASLWSRGIDRNVFEPHRRDQNWRREQGLRDEEIAILFFGRLVREKGTQTYVDVVEALQKKGLPVRPLLVGAGPARSDFARLSGVIATGHLRDDDLARAVASADIMLTPSVTETFGNVVLEAMASGVAVVSADAPSARGLITPGVTGWLCPPTAVPAYVEAVERIIGAPDVRCKVAQAALDASRSFTWDNASAAVERAYRSVLSG